MSRNLATVVVRGALPGLKRRRTGLLPSGPKSSFQMRASFVFHLQTKVLESGDLKENADELKAVVKETLASIPPQQCHKLITSMPRRIEAVIKAKAAPTKY